MADRVARRRAAGRPMADEGNPTHVARPDARADGRGRGARRASASAPATALLSIEAMKMETGVFAERDGVVREVLVSAGTQVDTEQLLMVLED